MAAHDGPREATFDKDIRPEVSEALSSADAEASTASASAKAVQRKVDFKILLWYSFVYLIMRIHVSNITNVAIINVEAGHGIKKQLASADLVIKPSSQLTSFIG
jgi:hypothetical protein